MEKLDISAIGESILSWACGSYVSLLNTQLPLLKHPEVFELVILLQGFRIKRLPPNSLLRSRRRRLLPRHCQLRLLFAVALVDYQDRWVMLQQRPRRVRGETPPPVLKSCLLQASFRRPIQLLHRPVLKALQRAQSRLLERYWRWLLLERFARFMPFCASAGAQQSAVRDLPSSCRSSVPCCFFRRALPTSVAAQPPPAGDR